MAQIDNQGSTGRFLDNFKSRLIGGGVRPNLFEVELAFPTTVEQSDTDLVDKVRFLVKSAALPASNISPIEVPFRGRILKIAGDRTFDTWTITVINDKEFRIRNAFERWMNFISKHGDNSGEVDPNIYQEDAYVYQLARAPVNNDAEVSSASTIPILRAYKFYGVFPTNISQIDLSYDSTDTIEEFTVELQVQWWEAQDDQGETLIG